MRKHNLLILLGLFASVSSFYSQNFWGINGNANTTAGINFLGTTNNQAVDIRTSNILRATVTTNNGLSTQGAAFSTPLQVGDGIRIAPGNGSAAGASLDLFTSQQNQTFIRMDGTALLGTTNSRFEQIANLNGFWYNVTGNGANAAPGPFQPFYIWNMLGAEKGRLGSNGFWRFGNNAGALNANNNVEIVSQASSPYGGVIALNGASGLRLTNLTSSKTPLVGINGINPLKVLTVDQNGDVVLTTAAGVSNADNGLSTNGPTPNSVHLGQNVAAAGNPGQLLNNRWVPMNNFNISFRDPVGSTQFTNRLEIGNINPTVINAPVGSYNPKLSVCNVNGTSKVSGGYFSTVYDLSTNIGAVPIQILPYYFGNLGGSQKFGVVALGIDSTGGRGIGVTGFGYSSGTAGGSTAVGVSGKAYSKNGTRQAFGMQAVATGNAILSYGILANATGNGSYNYAVMAGAPTPNGTNTTNNNHYAGFFNGGVYIAQSIFPSDELIKKDKNNIVSAVSKLSQIDPISFKFDTVIANQKGLSLPGGLQYGFKAQQVETVYPELVTMIHKPAEKDSLGNDITPDYDFKGINYIGFIALLTKATQEQQNKIDSLIVKTTKQDSINNSLQAQINNIITTFSNCCSNSSIRTTSITGNGLSSQDIAVNQLDVELSDKDVITLSQNVPNPYAEQTTITYNVPAQYGFAQIIFKTVDGKIIKAVDITKKGKGQLNVFASDLSQGLYMYTLIVDGKVIDTKKMVKE